MKLLNGKDLADFVKERQAKAVRNLRQQWHVTPKLAIVQTIDLPVIDSYVRLKSQYAADILVECDKYVVDQSEVLSTIDALNTDDSVHGIIVQLPLDDPGQTDEVVKRVSPEKDVDGLGSHANFDPATPMAINWLLNGYGVELVGKKVAIVGRGRLVGAPLEAMWQKSGIFVATFGKVDDLSKLKQYDVIVTATGQPSLVHSDMIKIGATIVDAGTADANGQIVGDVAENVRSRDDLTITPVKGGVGPLTIAALLDNVITAARRTTETTKD